MNMSNFYLYLEPYTFIFKGRNNSFLLYNSESYQHEYFIDESDAVTKILSHLLDFENMYVVEIDQSILRLKSFNSFLSRIRISNFGDLVLANDSKYKPIIIPPIAYVKNSLINIKKDKELKGSNALTNALREITIYLNGICSLECKNCFDYDKQFLFCKKESIEFSKENLEILISNLNQNSNKTINICGGNIFKFTLLESFLERIIKINNKINLYIHYENIDPQIINNPLFKEVCFVILIDTLNKKNELISMVNILKKLNYSYKIHCVVENDNTCDIVSELEEELDSEIKLFPFYNNNEDFFIRNVFISHNEISSASLTKEMIFINQLINSNKYGKIIISPNGNVHDSLNSNPIGNIKDNSLVEIINRGISYDSNWFKLRKNFNPCDSCEYSALCPPLSSYEDIFGRNNLCVIYP